MVNHQTLTPSQRTAISITERVSSALSLLGFFLVITTYLFCTGFRKPVNRLIFYAQWSNLGTTIVGFLSYEGVIAGQDSALCQLQAFLFQMFGGVDVYWALCMSLNVYLALFRGWTTKKMQGQEWYYLALCYGLSLVPSVVYLFVNTENKGKVYGPALIWCWIDLRWAFLRIATMYAIVWVALVIALGIYCIALHKAWRHRRLLVGLLNPLNENPFAGIVTTEIEIVFSEAEEAEDPYQLPTLFHGRSPSIQEEELDAERQKKAPYKVSVQGVSGRERSESKSVRPGLSRIPTRTRNLALAEENAEAWLYARIAFLYFLAMMICWIPASINRLVSVIRPDKVIFGLNWIAALLLPLQGFLNALVYYVSSQTALKRIFAKMAGRSREKPTKDAQRIQSYPPRSGPADGGLVFHDATRATQAAGTDYPGIDKTESISTSTNDHHPKRGWDVV